MARVLQLFIVIVAVVAVLIEAAPPAKASAGKGSAGKAPAANAPGPKTPPGKAPEVKVPAAPTTISVGALLDDPDVKVIVDKLKSGKQPDSKDVTLLAIKGMMSGVQTSNPALNSIPKIVNDTLIALQASPDHTLTAGQAMKTFTTLITAVTKATNTPTENAAKFRECVFKFEKPSPNADQATIRSYIVKVFAECSIYLGDGTPQGNQAVIDELSKCIDPSIRTLIDPKGMNDIMQSIMGKGKGAGDLTSLLTKFNLG